ncbi:MAG: chorismate mutase [Clostridia bacterium]|nr:chorismate mutase [Clostridia bacterium]
MSELTALRARLDETDRELVAAFERRMRLSLDIADCKRAVGLPVLDAAREEQVLASRAAMLDDARWDEAVRQLYRTLMALSREAQEAEMGRDRP